MGFTEKQVGHMTVRKFVALYNVYKDTFDLENKLKNSNRTYRELEFEPTLDDVL
jgi:hypothetical protein